MAATPEDHPLTAALAELESNFDAVPWTRRRAIAKSLRGSLRDANQAEIALRVVRILARDPKWEVRNEIAGLLDQLADDDFAPLAAGLSEDPNSFVRTAADRSINRRRSEPRGITPRRRGLDSLLTEIDLLERMYGRPVAKKMRRMALQLYSELVGSTVHELRGVLTPLEPEIASIKKVVARKELDGAMLAERMDVISKRVALLNRFVEDLRAFAQPVPPERVPVSLDGIVDDAHNNALDQLRAMGLDPSSVKTSITVAPRIVVDAARHQIVSAVANVLKNGYEALPVVEGGNVTGKIVLYAEIVDGRDVRIVVEDDGAGIDSDDLREFQRFLPGRTTKKGRGTGFGLPTAQRYIQAHGGTIQIESGKNRGTKVTITIPIEAGQDAEA